MEGSVNSSVMGFPRAEAFDTSEAKRSFVVRKSGPQDHTDAKQVCGVWRGTAVHGVRASRDGLSAVSKIAGVCFAL